MKQKRIGTKRNGWKWAFLLLLAVNIAFWGVIVIRVMGGSAAAPKSSRTITNPVKVGTITTTKEELNQALTSYLNDYQSKNMGYSVRLTSTNIEFQGSYKLLGSEVPLYIYFEPYHLKSGAIQLKVTSMSVGNLPLPEAEVLSYIRSSYKLPSFVEILPKKSVVNINLQNIDNDSGLYLKSTAINLATDEINFDILKKNR
ncbi:YpmS family protein [Streptococcus devriesei]|uniref:YpmS family protein n=1 Tax=Streptococcus devriesei TaxID=231233 RepID=UPI0004093396|nr:YpmS family protein [Streptococcus devriesei]